MPDWFATIVFVVLSLGVGALGGYWTARSIPTWYEHLNKPTWNPPKSVFGPVWTGLYILMGVAAGFAWKQSPWGPWSAIFAIQLLLNLAWSYLFFGLRRPDWAALEIVILWLTIAVCTLTMFFAAPVAGILMLPYLAWVTFAGVLNAVVARLNPPLVEG